MRIFSQKLRDFFHFGGRVFRRALAGGTVEIDKRQKVELKRR